MPGDGNTGAGARRLRPQAAGPGRRPCRAKDAGASYILPMFGVTLRSGSREHFHATLDREFPGLKARYEACFGNRYECFSPSYRKLDDTFRNLCAKLGLETRMRFYAPTLPEQGSLF